jgi:hypothetical protein
VAFDSDYGKTINHQRSLCRSLPSLLHKLRNRLEILQGSRSCPDAQPAGKKCVLEVFQYWASEHKTTQIVVESSKTLSWIPNHARLATSSKTLCYMRGFLQAVATWKSHMTFFPYTLYIVSSFSCWYTQHSPFHGKINRLPNQSLAMIYGHRDLGHVHTKLHPCLKPQRSLDARNYTWTADLQTMFFFLLVLYYTVLFGGTGLTF